MASLLIVLIKLYKYLVSPLLASQSGLLVPSGCRFYPSCSEYALQAIQTKGAIKGTRAAIIRIIKCNPL